MSEDVLFPAAGTYNGTPGAAPAVSPVASLEAAAAALEQRAGAELRKVKPWHIAGFGCLGVLLVAAALLLAWHLVDRGTHVAPRSEWERLGYELKQASNDAMADAEASYQKALREGKDADQADGAFQATLKTQTNAAYARTIGKAHAAIQPSRTPIKDEAQRKKLMELHGVSETELRKRGR